MIQWKPSRDRQIIWLKDREIEKAISRFRFGIAEYQRIDPFYPVKIFEEAICDLEEALRVGKERKADRR